MADTPTDRQTASAETDVPASAPKPAELDASPTDGLSRVSALRWLVVIIAVAAVLRAVGLTYQLPVPSGPDAMGLIAVALRMGTGDLNPHMFTWPAAPFYFMAACYGVMFGVCRLLGIVEGSSAFKQWFFDDPTAFFVVTRLIMVTFGLLSVAAMYRLGCALGSRRRGLLAAAILAVTPAEVIFCHYQKSEPMLVLTTILALWALVRWWQRDGLGRVALAGAAIGLAIAVKYNASLLVLPALATWIHHVARSEPRSWRRQVAGRLAVGIVCMLLVFLALNPYLLLDAGEAMRQLTGQKLLTQGETPETPRSVPMLYLRTILPVCFGWVLYVAFGLAMAWLVVRAVRQHDESVLLLVFVLPYAAAMMTQKIATPYYPLPIVPALAIGTAGLVGAMHRYSRLITRAFVILLALPAGRCVVLACELALPSPVFKAEFWVAGNVPAGERIAHNHWLPPILPDHRHQFGHYHVAKTHPTVDDVRRLLDAGVRWFVFDTRRVDGRVEDVFGPRDDALAVETARFDAPDTYLPYRSGGVTIWRATQPTDVPPLVRVLPTSEMVEPAHAINTVFEHGLILLGVDQATIEGIEPGRVVEVATFWHLPAEMPRDLLMMGEIRGTGGIIADLTHRFGYGVDAVVRSSPNESLNVVHRVLLRPALRAKPGEYEAVIGLRDPESGRELQIIDGPGTGGVLCKLANLHVGP